MGHGSILQPVHTQWVMAAFLQPVCTQWVTAAFCNQCVHNQCWQQFARAQTWPEPGSQKQSILDISNIMLPPRTSHQTDTVNAAFSLLPGAQVGYLSPEKHSCSHTSVLPSQCQTPIASMMIPVADLHISHSQESPRA